MMHTTDDLWDMSRIAAAFGVHIETVQSNWRNGTLISVRAHLADHGHDDADAALGVPVKRLTGARWATVRQTLGLPPLLLPRQALPIPNVMLGNKPGWTGEAIERWAADTGRRNPDGTFRKASPTGRPPGIAEPQPRAKRRPAAGSAAGTVAAA